MTHRIKRGAPAVRSSNPSVTVSMSPALLDKLEACAKARDMNNSAFVREFLTRMLDLIDDIMPVQ